MEITLMVFILFVAVGDAPELLEGLEQLKVISPEVIEFICDVDLGSPAAEIQWFKDDKVIKAGDKYKMSYVDKDESAVLTINRTALQDAGQYKIVVQNLLGEVTSEGSLSVLIKPSINPDSSSPVSSRIKDGSQYASTANFTGYPIPKVVWTLNEQPIDNVSANIDATETYSRLQWKNVTTECAGTITATATNEAGTASTNFDVVVIGKPTPPQDLAVEEVTKDSVSLVWSAPKSNGGSDITSYIVERMDVRRGTWISAGTTKSTQRDFNIGKLTTGNEYMIRVFAENEVGASEPAALDAPVVPKSQFSEPGAPENVACENLTAVGCVLIWDKPSSNGGTPITGYVVERKSQYNARWTKVNKVPVSDLELEINDLVEGTDYDFRVYAENQVGAGPPSSPIGPLTAQAPKGKQQSYVYDANNLLHVMEVLIFTTCLN